MSATMLRINLSELQTVRVRCLQCQRGVVEVTVAKLDEALRENACRLCGRDVFRHDEPNPFNDLRLALERLAGLIAKKDIVEVEFEIPTPSAVSRAPQEGG